MVSLEEHYQLSTTPDDFGTSNTRENCYYPVGNSYPTDITHGCQVAKQFDALWVGCGDVRNVLHTLSAINGRNAVLPDQVLNFHLNDKESAILARDLILLYLIKTTDAENTDDCKFLWAVWQNALLPLEHWDRLHETLETLSLHKSGDLGIYYGNPSTEEAVKACITSWKLQDKMSAPILTEKRLKFLKSINMHNSGFPDTPTERVASRIYMQHQIFAQDLFKNRLFEEVRNYIETGVSIACTPGLSQRQVLTNFYANTTFMRPGQTEWNVPDDSCYFMSWNVDDKLEKYDGNDHNVGSLCLERLMAWLKSVRCVCDKGCQLQVYLWLEDAICLSDTGLPKDLKFDFIDTSNLADELGLIPLIVHCQEKLKENGVLTTESYQWMKMTDDGSKILRKCIDINPLMYPTILGVHLAEETVLGHENLLEEGAFVGCGKITLRWRKARNNTRLDAVGSSDAVSTFLAELGTDKYKVETSTDFLPYTNISVVRFDERTRSKLKTRLNAIISSSGSTSESTAVSETVIEYNDRYEIYVRPGSDGLREKWRCFHSGCDVNNVTFTSTGKGTVPINKTLDFSCAVTMNSKKIHISKAAGFVQFKLFKDTDLNIGERLMPSKQLEKGEVDKIEDYPETTFWLKNLNSYIIIAYPKDGFPLAIDVPFPEPRHQLKDLFELFLKTMPITERVQVIYAPKTDMIRNPLDDFYAAFRVDGFKLWENKPTLFVTWFRFDKAAELLRQRKLKNVNLEKQLGYTGNNIRVIPHLRRLMRGYELFTSILEVNSHRLVQDGPSDKRWKVRTFIRARYPFKLLKAYENNIRLKSLSGSFAPKYDDGQRNLVLGLHALGLANLIESPEGREAILAVGESSHHECDSCGERSPNCKRCSACYTAFYCSRECQLAAWPKHKKQCKKTKHNI